MHIVVRMLSHYEYIHMHARTDTHVRHTHIFSALLDDMLSHYPDNGSLVARIYT